MFKKSEGQLFDQVAKDAESVYTFQMWPLVAEIKSIKNAAKSAIFNFSSAIKGHLENVNTLLTSLVTWSKSCPSDFWKMV